jgi:hypothetical protein
MKKRFAALLLMTALAASVGYCQMSGSAGQAASVPFNSSSSSSSPSGHGVFTVELAKPLDSKKLKQGDVVEAKLPADVRTPGGTTIPRGSKVIGHVTEAKAKSKGDAESQLGIVFDKISRPGGEETTIKGVIQAVAPNPNAEVQTGGGVGYGGMSETMEKPPTPSQGARSVPLLTDESKGVLGIKNLELGPDGVLSSSGKEVKLDSGTRVLVDATM